MTCSPSPQPCAQDDLWDLHAPDLPRGDEADFPRACGDGLEDLPALGQQREAALGIYRAASAMLRHAHGHRHSRSRSSQDDGRCLPFRCRHS